MLKTAMLPYSKYQSIPARDICSQPEIVQRLADGDREAFNWIYRNYFLQVFNYMLIITNDRHFSEDITQEVFLRLWEKRERLAAVTNFNAYFCCLYRNKLVDTLKNRHRRVAIEMIYQSKRGVTIEATQPVLYKEELQRIRKAVKGLPPRQRMVLILTREYALKREKIARLMQVSPFTVKVQLQKAMANLRASSLHN